MMSSFTSTVVVTSITWLFAHYLFLFRTNNIPEELFQLSYGYKRFCDKNNLTDQHCFLKFTNIIEDLEDLDIEVRNAFRYLDEKCAYHTRVEIEKNNNITEIVKEDMSDMMNISLREIEHQIHDLQFQLKACECKSYASLTKVNQSFQNFSDALRSQNNTLSTNIWDIGEQHQHDKKKMYAALESTKAYFDTRLDHNSRIITWLTSESEKNHTAVHEDLKLKIDNITFYLVAASLLLGEIYIALAMCCKKPTYYRRTLDVSDLSNTL